MMVQADIYRTTLARQPVPRAPQRKPLQDENEFAGRVVGRMQETGCGCVVAFVGGMLRAHYQGTKRYAEFTKTGRRADLIGRYDGGVSARDMADDITEFFA